jgi:hypothetical protein
MEKRNSERLTTSKPAGMAAKESIDGNYIKKALNENAPSTDAYSSTDCDQYQEWFFNLCKLFKDWGGKVVMTVCLSMRDNNNFNLESLIIHCIWYRDSWLKDT